MLPISSRPYPLSLFSAVSSSCTDCLSAPLTPPAAAEASAHWAAIASLTIGVFGLVTAEFLPAC